MKIAFFFVEKGELNLKAVEVGEGIEEGNESVSHKRVISISWNYQRNMNQPQVGSSFEAK